MFELYGIQTDYEGYEVRILIATFDTMEAAKEYVEASIVPPSERLIKRRPYHPASVLGAYASCDIEEGTGIPHNPNKNW